MWALVPALVPVVVVAAPPSVQDSLRQRLAEDRVRMRFLRREEASIADGLEELQRELEARVRSTIRIEERLTEIEIRVATVQERQESVKVRRARILRELAARAHAMRRLSKLRLVVATSTRSRRRTRDRLRQVLAYDRDLLDEAVRLGERERALERRLQEERRHLESLRTELETATEQMLELREERAALLRAVRNERVATERLAAELSRAADRTQQEAQKLRGLEDVPLPTDEGFEAQRGRLPWPVVGRLEVPFGKTVDPPSLAVMVQKGVDLRAPRLAPVHAVYSGTVVHAGWVTGFGRVVILDHGDEFHTVYAHLERFGANRGARVRPGRIIGFVGDSGSSKGAVLHFQIRHRTRAVDPLDWLVEGRATSGP